MRLIKQSANRKMIALLAWQIVFVSFVIILGQLVLIQNVSADMKSDCLSNSGGREGIASVDWACGVWADEYGETNVCSLWLGGDNSVDPTIHVESLNEIKTVHYYGMCTDYPNTTSLIWAENDNNSIDNSVNLTRGYWGIPTFVDTTLNVARFVEGVPKVVTSEGDKYTRNINICRMNGSATSCDEYFGACDCMEEEVSVVVESEDSFYGKSVVSSSDEARNSGSSAELGFTQEDGKVTYYIDNCDSVNGCSAKFWHYLKRESGNGSTTYSISRTSNYSSVDGGVVFSNMEETFDRDNPVMVHEEAFVNKLRPGQVVCETLTFTINDNGEKKSLTVCASALGDAQPPDPDLDSASGDRAYLNIKVKNNNVTKYDSYQRTVYAKPGDTLSYRSTYNPVLQYAYYIVPDKIKIDNGTILPLNSVNSDKLGDIFKNTALFTEWKNAYAVNGNFGGLNKTYRYDAGDTETRTNIDEYRISWTEAGRSLDGVAQTNSTGEIMTTPRQVSFESYMMGEGDYNVAHVFTDALRATAYAKVPYNYRTAIGVNSNSETVGAGETGTIDVTIDVLPKVNNETTNGGNDNAYATVMRGASVKTIVYVPGAGTTKVGMSNYMAGGRGICDRYASAAICSEATVATDRTFNSEGNLAGKIGDGIKAISFNVPDLDAGTEICVAAAVYPSNSGDDTNLDRKGNDKWNVSDSKCFVVAKKPSIEVWGGGIFSSGDISLPISRKNNLSGYADYDINTRNRFFVFGSWAESEIVALGTVTGLGSGASTGFSHINNGNLWPSYNNDNSWNTELLATYGPGGSYENTPNYCLRSILTFANNNCLNNRAGKIGNSTSKENLERSKKYLVEMFKENQDRNNVIYENHNDYTIADNVLMTSGTTRVIDASSFNVTIEHDISFLDNQIYNRMSEIPKLIIYARNININCDVNRIDAVLIAENNINTCYNSDNINDRINSNQLIINGSVITDTLSANRTYGAAKGANSIIPAEIINYDATLYLWGNNESSLAGGGRFSSVYLREVAPRY